MANAEKYVYFFAANKAEGKSDMKNMLGGKGANLAEMSNIGIPVPPGLTITTEVCNKYYENKKTLPKGLKEQIDEALKKVEAETGKKFGDPKNPLLVSVRSGARVSMPGMMDTVLNLGLNDKIAEGLAKLSKNERFAWDSYRRFIQMYGDVVMGLQPENKDDVDPFEEIIEGIKSAKGVESDLSLTTEDLKELVSRFKKAIKNRTGQEFPTNPKEQLWGAIMAVFNSWNNDRAIKYRQMNDIPGEWGTAVNVQAMVYGNMGEDSATGVAFTRDPSTGENMFYGEFLINAQGEDVVAGIRTPQPMSRKGSKNSNAITLEDVMPDAYKQLVEIRATLEDHYKDMQDIEFTIERNKLWMLQTRTGKRTAAAAIKIAAEMVDQGFITKKEALLRIAPNDLDQLLHPTFDPKAKKTVMGKGLPASPGAASGRVVFNAEDAENWAAKGEKVVLVRIETSPEDIGGMAVAEGILTARGGMTSHAAVVARGMGKCCVAGVQGLVIDYNARTFKFDRFTIKEGDFISLNGSTGEVMNGKVDTIEPELSGNFAKIMEWAKKTKKLGVRTNADTPKDSKQARNFGAEGIGLCRTEHMFFEGDRIDAVREMIMAEDIQGRKTALNKLLAMQTEDFEGIFEAMDGLPVTIRTLDPPLHEFLPHREELNAEIYNLKFKLTDADDIKEIDEILSELREKEELLVKVKNLSEQNPMLGLRGCRLGTLYPEITEMQAKAIMEAACSCKKRGIDAKPEIMIPLVSTEGELRNQKEVVKKVANEVIEKTGVEVDYLIGTMIELPRAALIADEIARQAEFFSFGTNDLTQTTFGLSRDDSGKFLPEYIEKKILERDPFEAIDQKGVGQLLKIAVEKGKSTRPNIKLGICGEHGGEPSSVKFCHGIGFDYVSCSPYRVPIAILAAAQSAINEE